MDYSRSKEFSDFVWCYSCEKYVGYHNRKRHFQTTGHLLNKEKKEKMGVVGVRAPVPSLPPPTSASSAYALVSLVAKKPNPSHAKASTSSSSHTDSRQTRLDAFGSASPTTTTTTATTTRGSSDDDIYVIREFADEEIDDRGVKRQRRYLADGSRVIEVPGSYGKEQEDSITPISDKEFTDRCRAFLAAQFRSHFFCHPQLTSYVIQRCFPDRRFSIATRLSLEQMIRSTMRSWLKDTTRTSRMVAESIIRDFTRGFSLVQLQELRGDSKQIGILRRRLLEDLFPDSLAFDVYQYIADRLVVAAILSQEAELKWRKSCPFVKQIEQNIEKNGRGPKPCLKWTIDSRKCLVRIHYLCFVMDVDKITAPYVPPPDWVLQIRNLNNGGTDGDEQSDEDDEDDDDDGDDNTNHNPENETEDVHNSNSPLIVPSMW
eukprot:TRINITY_DN3998_c0_g1_i1.p1 TRINITY_DN3998_c0_g1~~TRINITY_DN3998_c0_g1_i1.p1  ORF type:complete len:431 (-),score=83.65 TRINITY_DN3998_c0_g1_i1:43-1335(-)